MLFRSKSKPEWIRKMIQKKNSVLIRKKRMRIEGNQKNHEITHGCAIFVGNLRRQTPLHQQKGVQISVPLKMKMSPSDQILAQTLTFSCQIQGNLSVASQSKNQSAWQSSAISKSFSMSNSNHSVVSQSVSIKSFQHYFVTGVVRQPVRQLSDVN